MNQTLTPATTGKGTKMFWLKACPRCQGDLLGQSDSYGSYIACLQCGYQLQPEEESQLGSGPGPASEKQAALAGKAA